MTRCIITSVRIRWTCAAGSTVCAASCVPPWDATHWERGGLVLYQKRLERGCLAPLRFDTRSRSYQLPWSSLVLMIEGVSLDRAVRRKRYMP